MYVHHFRECHRHQQDSEHRRVDEADFEHAYEGQYQCQTLEDGGDLTL